MTAPLNPLRRPPYKLAGLVLSVVVAVVAALVFFQFQGDLAPKTQLTLISPRSGLVTDPGSKVTFNGVEIGRVAKIEETTVAGQPAAVLTLDVSPKYVTAIPANVDARIQATTVFGNKYVAFRSPKDPSPQHITSQDVVRVAESGVTTEFNTLFETIVSIAEKVDPVSLNQTLSATAQALDGLGDRLGRSLVHGNEILADVNPQMPQISYDTGRLADLAEVYADASPDLWEFLGNFVSTAHTLNDEQANIDQALMASIGFSATGTDTAERAGPYFNRVAQDLIPTSELLDEYSPEILCTFRNYFEVAPKVYEILGGNNGYSLKSAGTLFGAANPYVYPDNLPRVNAKGGPEGRPGCWQPITHELWPAPYLVMDTGFSLAPYNHMELGQPMFTDYVWGRQVGEYTINP